MASWRLGGLGNCWKARGNLLGTCLDICVFLYEIGVRVRINFWSAIGLFCDTVEKRDRYADETLVRNFPRVSSKTPQDPDKFLHKTK